MADETKWLSISALAKRAGVAPQVLGRRVKAFAADGRLETRREGAAVLVDAAAYEALAAATRDPAQRLRNRRKRRGAKAHGEELETYDEAATREKNAKADLAEMRAALQRSELVRARDLEHAAARVATSVAQRLAALKSKAGKLYAACQGGEEALHVALGEEVDGVLREIAADMAGLAIEDGER